MALLNNKIKFLSGSSESLLAKTELEAKDIGTFFLTEDTHQLYIGLEANKPPVLLNEDVIFIEKKSKLPGTLYENRLYFIKLDENNKDLNSLCYYDKSSKNFVQINYTSNLVYAKRVTGIGEKDKPDEGKTYLNITIADDAEGRLESTQITGKTGGHEVSTDRIYFEGEGITIKPTDDGKGLVFTVPTGDVYKLKASTVNNNPAVTLTGTTTGSTFVELEGTHTDDTGTTERFITVAKDGDNKITLTGSDFNIDKFEASTGTGFTFKIGQTKAPENKESGATIDPILSVNGIADEDKVHFTNGEANLSSLVYSKAEINEKFNKLDAMRYKGTITKIESGAGNSTLPTEKVQIGDTYKYVGTSVKYGTSESDQNPFDSRILITAGNWIRQGDILIAVSTTEKESVTDETDGKTYIAQNDIRWTYVPSGDDYDTRYQLKFNGSSPSTSKTANSIEFTENGEETESTQTIVFAANKGLNLTTDPSGSTMTITYGHSNSFTQAVDGTQVEETYNEDGQSDSINSWEIEGDDYGHLKTLKKTVHILKDTHNHLKAGESIANVTGANNELQTVTHEGIFHMDDGESKGSKTLLKSETLALSVTSNGGTEASQNRQATINMELLWGQF